jgi:hypothetical protein
LLVSGIANQDRPVKIIFQGTEKIGLRMR